MKTIPGNATKAVAKKDALWEQSVLCLINQNPAVVVQAALKTEIDAACERARDPENSNFSTLLNYCMQGLRDAEPYVSEERRQAIFTRQIQKLAGLYTLPRTLKSPYEVNATEVKSITFSYQLPVLPFQKGPKAPPHADVRMQAEAPLAFDYDGPLGLSLTRIANICRHINRQKMLARLNANDDEEWHYELSSELWGELSLELQNLPTEAPVAPSNANCTLFLFLHRELPQISPLLRRLKDFRAAALAQGEHPNAYYAVIVEAADPELVRVFPNERFILITEAQILADLVCAPA